MEPTMTLEVLVTRKDRRAALCRDVREGLGGVPKAIPPVWFYDEAGSRLFDEITRLSEYYPTRVERAVLAARAGEIVAEAGAEVLVEIGSGTSDKTRLILDAMQASGSLRRIVLLDISEEVLEEAAATLMKEYGVEVRAVVGDFRTHIPSLAGGTGQLWAFLGSTIGNLTSGERHRLLGEMAGTMAPGDRLLLGTDLVKDPGRLVAAYDDAAGITAAFNRNLLSVLNRELGADFDPGQFEHRALWRSGEARIEMRLRARQAQVVHLPGIDLTVDFEAGEEILTEMSAKFRPAEIAAELAGSDLVVERAWQDPAGDFQVTMARLDRDVRR